MERSDRRYHTRNFNPRSPHGERLSPEPYTVMTGSAFQSTLPARGATCKHTKPGSARKFQSTLPARGATPGCRWHGRKRAISIHAPRTGSDLVVVVMVLYLLNFNPRSPHGERHVALAEPVQHREDFNPRSPHGERHTFAPDAITCKGKFQSTLPARGATPPRWAELFSASISIHAPRTGSDAPATSGRPREPISIHAPRTGSDIPLSIISRQDLPFQSTLPARGAT